jgi:hypothetical protein
MYEQILPWVWLGVLFILCLPISPIHKLVLEVCTWALRLSMIALLAAGAYLWFRPGDMPSQVLATLSDFPRLLSWLPDQTTSSFGLCLACFAVTALVPLLAVLEVSRKMAGWRFSQVRVLAATPAAEPRSETVSRPEPVAKPDPVGVPIMRPVQRRTAAQTITSAAAMHPAH